MKQIPLTQGFVALVDDADFEKLNQHKWHVYKAPGYKKYAVRGVWNGKDVRTIRMHREILGAHLGQLVDHMDHDGLNNQRSNIRLCNSQQNNRHRRPEKGCSSNYKGVSLNKPNQKWSAQIMIKEKIKYLGHFKREIDAAVAYDDAARTHFGAFAYTNFPDNIEIVLRKEKP